MSSIDKVCYNVINNKLGVVYLPVVYYNLDTKGGGAMVRARKVVDLEGHELLNSTDD